METRVVLSAAVLAVLLCSGRLAAQSEGDVQVRLVDGLTPYEGRLEVLYNDTWGTVCDTEEHHRYAEVVCRMLGLKNGAARKFGRGSSDQPIHMSYVLCGGTEDNIAQCPQRGWGVHDCDHRNDAGIVCLREGKEDVHVRLVGGQTENEGRVEVLYNGTWGTVCRDYWDENVASVVCSMFNKSGVAHYLFGPGSPTQPIHMSHVVCTGSEDNIGRCPHRGWGVHSCNHDIDVGVVCLQRGEEDVQVRLVGGQTENEGRVEVLYNGTWGTVRTDNVDDKDTFVVCGMLNRSLVSKFGYSFERGSQSPPIHMSRVSCTGSEDNIGRCLHRGWGVHSRRHSQDVVGVICGEQGEEDVQVRLVGGQTENEGRVEVLYNGTWGTVCRQYWDENDASVVCSMLNKVLVSSTLLFGPGSPSQPIHMSHVTCTGSEDNIGRCPHRGWGVHSCRHDSDIGVICAEQDQDEDVPVRLVGGQTPFEGIVEAFYNDTWTAVHFIRGVQHKGAAVVCRILGLPDRFALEVYLARSGQGQSYQPTHLEVVRCTGSEGNLGQCPHRSWDVHDYIPGVSLSCLQPGDTVGNVRLSGGPSAREGRLEVARGVYWGTVCDDQFDSRDAAVVCRTLGFHGTAQAVPGAYYGEGQGQVMLTRLGCTGQESFLFQCPQQSPSSLSCPHSQDVGVICHDAATVPPTNAHGEERHDVECTERSMKISIPSYLLPQGNVTLLDPSCPLTLNGTDYVIDVGLSQCGTTIHFTDDHVVFVNTILTKTDTGAVDLTVPVGCQYPRLSNVSIAYMPLTHQARFFETNWGKLDVSMEQYKDDQFSTSLGVAGSVARMSAGQTVYLQIHIHDVSQADLGVMPRICVVSPSPSPLESNVDLIIRNGCPVHEHVRLLPSPGPAYFRFAFTADTFRFDSGLVYVHCETSLCELGPSCPAFCGSQGNVNATSLPSGATAKPTGNTTLSVPFGRRRRSAEIPKESGTLLSAGPLLLVDEADAHAVPAGLVATIASIAAAAMVVVVALAVALHRARARNASVEKRLTAISVK